MSNSLQPHESQHASPPCPSPTPGVHPHSRPSSQWCHPAISSSVVLFSSWPQSLPASESFPMSQLFTRGGQSTGVSALATVLPKNTQGWSPSEWTGWISLQSKGLSRDSYQNTVNICMSCSPVSKIYAFCPYPFKKKWLLKKIFGAEIVSSNNFRCILKMVEKAGYINTWPGSKIGKINM